MTDIETRLASIVARYLRTALRNSASDDWREFIIGMKRKHDDLSIIDADARALLAEIESKKP